MLRPPAARWRPPGQEAKEQILAAVAQVAGDYAG